MKTIFSHGSSYRRNVSAVAITQATFSLNSTVNSVNREVLESCRVARFVHTKSSSTQYMLTLHLLLPSSLSLLMLAASEQQQ